MTYKIEVDGTGQLNFQHYQNKVGGGVRTAAKHINGNVINGVKFESMYIGVDDIDKLIEFLELAKSEEYHNNPILRSGN